MKKEEQYRKIRNFRKDYFWNSTETGVKRKPDLNAITSILEPIYYVLYHHEEKVTTSISLFG